jgi:undecaprenyl-diphosphatase
MDPTVVARWRAFSLVMLGAFLGMSVVVYAVGLLPGDGSLHREVLLARGTLAHAVARWTNYGGKWEFLLPAMVVLLTWSSIARRRWWLWSGIIPLAGGFEQLFKLVVGRPRPRGVNWGFPSGHVTAVATFAVLMLYLLSRERVSPAARMALLAASVALVGSVGYARIVLNAHWPSDVLGGIFLGAGCAAAAAWWDAAHPVDDPQRRAAASDTVRIGG